MDPTTELLLAIGQAFGVSTVTLALWIPLIIIVCNRLARVIPDNATGALGVLRMIFAVIGINVRNNTGVAPAVDTTGKMIQRTEPEAGQEVGAVIDVVEAAAPAIQDMFGKGAAAQQAGKDSDHAG